MKTKSLILSLLALVGLSFAVTSCNDGGDKPTPPPTDKGLKFTATPLTIDADGADATTFTVTFDGENVTSSSKTQIMHITDGVSEKLANPIFFTDEPGKYEFMAIYDGQESEVVTITATEVGESRNFFKNISFVQITSINCSFCPYMSTLIKALDEEVGQNRIKTIAMHNNFQGADPYHHDGTSQFTAAYSYLFAMASYPQGAIDLREKAPHNEGRPVNALASVQRSLELYPADCGIAINSKVEDGKIVANFSVEATRGNSFKLTAVVVEDGLVHPQLQPDNSTVNDYVHNNTLRDFFTPVTGHDLQQIGKGQEKSTGELSVNVDNSWNLDNCRIVVFVTSTGSYDGVTRMYVTNAADCKVGENLDYVVIN